MFTYKIMKIGRKWIDGIEASKGYKAQIEINHVSKDWVVGQTVQFEGKFDRQASDYGSKVYIYPTSREDRKQEEIEKWLSAVEKYSDYVYKKAVDELNHYYLTKEQEDRLKNAIRVAEKNSEINKAKSKIQSYLSYIEESANKGKYYDNGYYVVKENLRILKKYDIDTKKFEAKLNELTNLYENRKKEVDEAYNKQFFKIANFDSPYQEGQIVKNYDGNYGKVVKAWKFWMSDPEQYGECDTMDPTWSYNAKCDKTIVTDEDIEIYKKAEAEKKKKEEEEKIHTAAKKEYDKAAMELINYIKDNGIYPPTEDELPYPDGITIYDTHNSGGSGNKIVIVDNTVWELTNYCMEGDDWRLQNVGSCIAHYIEIDDVCNEYISIINNFRTKYGDPIH